MTAVHGLVPLVGLALQGARVTERDLGPASVGAPVWGPAGLLTDLELRAGLGPLRGADDAMARVVAAREALAVEVSTNPEAFFARSFAVDPWGTTRAVLGMHDALRDAGWDLEDVAGAGSRIAVLRRLGGVLAAGQAPGHVAGHVAGQTDRLVRIEAALAGLGTAPYAALALAEPEAAWPGRWQRVFAALRRLGTEVGYSAAPEVVPADGDTSDLARVQRFLLGGGRGTAPRLRHDGTFVLLRAETPEPLADAVAAVAAGLARAHPDETIAVLRTAEHGPLDTALARFQMPRLGGRPSAGVPLAGAWLSLLVALMRGPFDAEAAVDVLLLPDAGWQRAHARNLADALGRKPGLGHAKWEEELAKVRAEEPEAAERVLALLTPSVAPSGGASAPGAASSAGAADLDAEELARRIARVDAVLAQRTHAVRRRARAEDEADAAAADALETTRATLAAWIKALPARGAIAAGPLDALLRSFGVQAARAVTAHESGPLERVDDPAALRAPVDMVLWWGFVDPGAPPPTPFRQDECDALAAAGIHVPGPLEALARAAAAWRAVVLRARRRLVMAFPERIAGTRQRLHPWWSELCGRLAWTGETGERDLVRGVQAILGVGAEVVAESVSPTRVASAATAWQVTTREKVPLREPVSVSSLGTLVDCPLHFVLDRVAYLRAGAVGVLPSGPLVFGNLGHRLFEELFGRGLLVAPLDEAAVHAVLEALFVQEAAPLARPGRGAERRTLTRQLVEAVRQFVAWLTREGLTPVAVEESLADLNCGDVSIGGRVDLRARAADGRTVIVDFKWSTRSHETAIQAERAVQLASYVRAHRTDLTQAHPARAVLFGLRDARAVEANADRLAGTWARLEREVGELGPAIARGEIAVRGLTAQDPDAVCRYCQCALICARGQEAGA